MNVLAWAFAIALAIAPKGTKAPRPSPPPPPPPLVPMPSLPVLSRIRIDVGKDALLVTYDVSLARGDWRSGDQRFYVAFGAPGTPSALDAKIFAATATGHLPDAEAVGEQLLVERAARRPSYAQLLLGPADMAGVVVRISEPSFVRATAAAKGAVVRLRTVVEMPAADQEGAHDLVLRLGSALGTPLTVGEVVVHSSEGSDVLQRVEAKYCGPYAEPYPVAVTADPGVLPYRRWPAPASPPLLRRHGSDDLCLRFGRAHGASGP